MVSVNGVTTVYRIVASVGAAIVPMAYVTVAHCTLCLASVSIVRQSIASWLVHRVARVHIRPIRHQ